MGAALKPHIGDAAVIPRQSVEGVEAIEMVVGSSGAVMGSFTIRRGAPSFVGPVHRDSAPGSGLNSRKSSKSSYDRATEVGGAQLGGGDCLTCPPVDSDRIIAMANCAVADSCRFQFAGEVSAESAAVTEASKRAAESIRQDSLNKNRRKNAGDHGVGSHHRPWMLGLSPMQWADCRPIA